MPNSKMQRALAASKTIAAIANEMRRQVDLFGEQRHDDGTGRFEGLPVYDRYATFASVAANMKRQYDVEKSKSDILWSTVLLEEVFEAMEADDIETLKEELVQVAAVAMSWLVDIETRDPQVLNPKSTSDPDWQAP